MLLRYLVPVMAFIVTVKHQLFALSLIIVFVFNGKLGNSVFEVIPSNGGQSGSQSGGQSGSQSGFGAQSGTQSGSQTGQFGGQIGGQAGGSVEDPTPIIAKALLCFDDNYVYSSCQESYRLTESGELHVPHEDTNQFCEGPCLTETHLVLNCIGSIMTHFEFYNKATLQDVSDTVKDGCGYGNQRGNFNVAEHVQEENSGGDKITMRMVAAGFVLMILVQGLLF
ncbi:uncharacterized protein LOC131324596 isoform X2 [Rhododendron vialii]|uniref:uncharacterized protein LOC131324596 isoform X2 n=1 Tax=Rhododendron vialii TaxID=182163 RepID=UPI00266042C9|nr:uncharacterized protein LOC131324596 isoform X2 [Rhododendron vialii]